MSAVSGKSILDLLWEKLDNAVDDLMYDPNAIRTKGYALGMAEAIACVEDPYSQDVDDVRGEAMARWQERNPD